MSSPFPIPQLTHPSPSQLHAGPAFSPSPLSQLLLSSTLTSHLPTAGAGAGAATGPVSTPNATSFFPGVSPSYQLPGFTPPSYIAGLVPPQTGSSGTGTGLGAGAGGVGSGMGQPGGWGMAPAGGLSGAQTEQDGLVRGLGEADGLLRRMEVVSGDIEGLEQKVFGWVDGEARAGSGDGDLGRLEQLHMEYTQLLLNLLTLSQSSLFGALPCIFPPAEPLSSLSTDPTKPPSPPNPSEAAPAALAPQPTLPELTKWAEERASLEFSRREALRTGGKAVLDVLKSGAAGR